MEELVLKGRPPRYEKEMRKAYPNISTTSLKDVSQSQVEIDF